MKTSINKFVLLLASSFLITIAGFAQTAFHAKGIDIKLSGTSNIHDWEMNASKGTSEASLTIDAAGKVTAISKLSFSLPAESLKSEHAKMDKNTYKALNTDDNPNISFVLSSATVTQTSANNYQLNCYGKLTIAGSTRVTNLLATAKFNPSDNSFTVVGEKKMKMTDYNVKPPKAMLGTIKTGNDITIAYTLKLRK